MSFCHAPLVQSKISDLRRMQGALQKLVRACGAGGKGRGCPIIDNLAR